MDLKKHHRKILISIIKYTMANGYPPTVRELCSMTGYRSTSTMAGHLKRLEREGYISTEDSKPRTLKVISTF